MNDPASPPQPSRRDDASATPVWLTASPTVVATAGFGAVLAAIVGLEGTGAPAIVVSSLFVVCGFAIYAAIVAAGRTAGGAGRDAARRRPAAVAGLAIGSDWINAASFIGLAGALYHIGYDALAFVLGWAGGLALLAVLIAPFLRGLGAATLPDFMAIRFGRSARVLSIIVLAIGSLVAAVAQVSAIGLITARFLDVDIAVALSFGFTGLSLCLVLGGLRSAGWSQGVLYVVLIAAYLAPAALLSAQKFGIPVPAVTYGRLIQELVTIEHDLVARGLAAKDLLRSFAPPFLSRTPVEFFAILLALVAGTAAMPHVVARSVATAGVRATRRSLAWGLLLAGVLLVSAPALAAFLRHEVYTTMIGAPLTALGTDGTLGWIVKYGRLGLVRICGHDAVDLAAVAAACREIVHHPGVLRLQDLALDADALVLAAPELAGMPTAMTGLVATGGLMAALAAADGLLRTVTQALVPDDRTVTGADRDVLIDVVTRAMLVVLAGLATLGAVAHPADILTVTTWAFSLAAAGLFPALVMGLWWRHATAAAAAAAIVTGFGVCLFYIVVSRYFPQAGVEHFGMRALPNPTTGRAAVDVAKVLADPIWRADVPAGALNPLASKIGWLGIGNLAAGLFGAVAGFVTIVVVSVVTPGPSRAAMDRIEAARMPHRRPPSR